jgi:hypothetical protein
MRKPHVRLFQYWLTAYSIAPTSCFAAVRGEASCLSLPSSKSRCEWSDICCVHFTNIERLNVLERAQGPERSGSTKNVGCLKVDGNKSSIYFLGIYNHFTSSLCSSIASLWSGTASVIDSNVSLTWTLWPTLIDSAHLLTEATYGVYILLRQ